MSYGTDDKNIAEYYLIYPVSLFLYFGQNGQFFVHISKRGLKALYYKLLNHFLPTFLSYIPLNFLQKKNANLSVSVLLSCSNLAVTYSHMGNPHTTIGVTTFHFWVRHGFRWVYCTLAARIILFIPCFFAFTFIFALRFDFYLSASLYFSFRAAFFFASHFSLSYSLFFSFSFSPMSHKLSTLKLSSRLLSSRFRAFPPQLKNPSALYS